MNCPLCDSGRIERTEVRRAVFRHIDFETAADSIQIGECADCGLLFQVLEGSRDPAVLGRLTEPAYARRDHAAQTVNAAGYPAPVTRGFLQAEILSPLIRAAAPAILDIGCFKGELLSEIGRRFPEARLHGLDSNGHLRGAFPRGPRFHFSTSLDDLTGPYDLICSSHSLIYLPNLRDSLVRIGKMLAPGGIWFVQTTDADKNPPALLLADQYCFFSASSLPRVLGQAGFEFTPIPVDWSPRDAVGLARFRRNGASTRASEGILQSCVSRLDRMADNISSVSRVDRLGILGTTLNAAFADSVLGDRALFFADEDSSKVGGIFRGKKVVHPAELTARDTLILPYGDSSDRILSRFKPRCPATFLCA